MKQQFTYSLDEAKIRKQLQDLNPGNAEDAWHKFSQYADSQPRQVSAKKLPGVRLKIDRRILVPAAAAVVLIVLAMLLFNYMDFKGSKGNAEKAVVAEPFVPMPQISEAETILPPLEKRDPMESQFENNTQALAATKPEVVKEKSEKPSPLRKDATADQAVAVSEKTSSKVDKPSGESQTTQAEVKKQKRETSDQLAPLQLPEIRPTLLTDEQVDDIRPN